MADGPARPSAGPSAARTGRGTPSNPSDRPAIGRGLKLLLVALTAIGPASFQIFLPALPAIQNGFGVTFAHAQLALSLSMLGIALAALTYGAISDRLGRRRTMLGGMALLLVGSLVCAASTSIDMLILGRILQAAGGTAGMVIGRVIVVDIVGRDAAGRVLGTLLVAMIVAPMLATPVGGVLVDSAGWRSNFLLVAALAAVMLVAVHRILPETCDGVAAASVRRGGAWRLLLSNRCFAGFSMYGAFVMGGYLGFVTGAPWVLTGLLGLTASEMGLWFIVITGGFAGGGLLARQLPEEIALTTRIRLAAALGIASGCVSVGLAVTGAWSPAALMLPAAAFALAAGLGLPAAQAGALGADKALAGVASGLFGFTNTIVGAFAVQVIGLVHDDTPVPVSFCLLLAGVAAVVAGQTAFLTAAHRSEATKR